jgi:hypothetical protein
MTASSAPKKKVPKLVKIEHKAEGFSVSLPVNWGKKQDVEMQGYKIALTALRPAAKRDVFREHIVVAAEKLPSAMTPEEYMTASLEGLSGSLKDFKLLYSGTLKDNPVPAAAIVYTYQMSLDLKVMLFFIPKGEKGYTLTCTATPATFNKYRDLFIAIGQSFMP